MSPASISRPHGIVKWRFLLDTPVLFTSQARIAGRRGIVKWRSLFHVEALFTVGFLASRSTRVRNHSTQRPHFGNRAPRKKTKNKIGRQAPDAMLRTRQDATPARGNAQPFIASTFSLITRLHTVPKFAAKRFATSWALRERKSLLMRSRYIVLPSTGAPLRTGNVIRDVL